MHVQLRVGCANGIDRAHQVIARSPSPSTNRLFPPQLAGSTQFSWMQSPWRRSEGSQLTCVGRRTEAGESGEQGVTQEGHGNSPLGNLQ